MAEGVEKEKEEGPVPVDGGGDGPNYTWTQELGELAVRIPVPMGTRGRDTLVSFEDGRLSVRLKKDSEPLIDAPLYKKIKEEDSTWQIDETKDGKFIVIYLSKSNQMEWWKCVCEGHPEIDTTKIQPENSRLSDLDGDTRGMVEKMMFDQQQKMMGRPTSDELKKQEALQSFMKQHPEMDFSNAKIQ